MDRKTETLIQCLHKTHPRPISWLAQINACSKQAVASLVARLRDEGLLLERGTAPSKGMRGYSARLFVTSAKGRKALSAQAQKYRDWAQEIEDALDGWKEER